MLFSGVSFLYFFLPAALLAYFIAPSRWKNAVLLLFSLLFYAWGEPKFLLLMLVSIVQSYVFGLLIQANIKKRQAKVYLALSVVLSLAMLGYFKYAEFFVSSFSKLFGMGEKALGIALPIGISFYTFQSMSYVIDVYRGSAKAQRNFVDLALYIAMFPQLIAGPIVRYTDIEPRLSSRRHSLSDAAAGTRKFVIGLSKKLVIANLLGELAEKLLALSAPSLLSVWLYPAVYALQIYFDFSAYSDMAVGLGRIFGFRFCRNFDYPFVSASITEFWRRWHISLGSWFRDYLYIPLGGSRRGAAITVRNIFIVWLATGLWHGAAWNFVMWGLFFAVMLTLEKLFLLDILKKHRIAAHIYTLFFLSLSFVMFGAQGVGDAVGHIGAMFGASSLPLVSDESLYFFKSYFILLIIAVVAATQLPKRLYLRLQKYKAFALAEPVLLPALLILCTAYLIDGSFNPFLYFRF